MIHKAQSFLVIDQGAGAYGLADSLSCALKRCRHETGTRAKRLYTVVAFDCVLTDVDIYAEVDLRYEIPQHANAMRFEAHC